MGATAQVIPMSKDVPWRQWKKRIETSWQKGVEAIIETGQHLIDAKNDPKMPHGSWEAMVAVELPFNPRTARKLMAIAAHAVLSNRSHGSVLPPSWTTLYELSTLPPPLVKEKIADGTITPKMERKDAAALKPKKQTQTKKPKADDAVLKAFAYKFKDDDWKTKAEMVLRLLDHLGISISHVIKVHPKASTMVL
jgi:hypothetical protein